MRAGPTAPRRDCECCRREKQRGRLEEFTRPEPKSDRGVVETTIALHYGVDEEQVVVVLLLALISAWPQALVAFLSAWEPHARVKDRVRGLIPSTCSSQRSTARSSASATTRRTAGLGLRG